MGAVSVAKGVRSIDRERLFGCSFHSGANEDDQAHACADLDRLGDDVLCSRGEPTIELAHGEILSMENGGGVSGRYYGFENLLDLDQGAAVRMTCV
jgi:hypothetical protein